MFYGYARGLDRRPRPQRPTQGLKAAGCERVFKEKITGAGTVKANQYRRFSASNLAERVDNS